MKTALITGASEKLQLMISETLIQDKYRHIDIQPAFQENLLNTSDLIFVNLRHMDGAQLSLAARATQGAAVVVLIPAAEAEWAERALIHTQAVVLRKPLSSQALAQGIRLASSIWSKLTAMQQENALLRQKLEDIKVIDRAKCCLVASLHMDEQQAHRYIQKKAMDTRLPQREIAQEILNTYKP